MEDILIILGNALMVILAAVSFVSSIIIILDIRKSKQLKDRKNIRKNLDSNAYLMENLGLLVPTKFIYGHKNTGQSPCSLENLEIDDIYLLDFNSVLVDKEIKLR